MVLVSLPALQVLINFLCDFAYYLCHGIFLIIKVPLFQVENLFYNMIARRKTLQSSSDDYPKIIDLISRFAVHNISVSFSCRKVSQHLMLQWNVNANRTFILICCMWNANTSSFIRNSTAQIEQMFTRLLHVQGWMLSELCMVFLWLVIWWK